PGGTCGSNAQCVSGLCVDGVCCTSACTGACEACDVAGAIGTCTPVPDGQDLDTECAGDGTCGGVCNGAKACRFPAATTSCGTCRQCDGVGACGFVAVDTDPQVDCPLCEVCDGNGACNPADLGTDVKNECAAGTTTSCGLNGTCDGASACDKYGTETVCTAGTCSGTTHNFDDLCDGTGSCTDAGTESCVPYACVGTTCATTCTTDADCAPSFMCNTTTSACVPTKVDGDPCASANECVSGHCQNGYCCASGNCCATTANCAAFAVAPSCTTASLCDGERTDATCNGNKQCVTAVVDDDTACAAAVCVNASCTSAGALQHIAAKTCNAGGQCNQGGGIVACADGEVCTTDLCTPAAGCAYEPSNAVVPCYTGAAATRNVGICKDGTQTCSGSTLGPCVGETVPGGETCDVGNLDEDCDGTVNEENAAGCKTYYKDADADTYGIATDTKCLCAPSGSYTATQSGDCDDTAPNVSPGATESCNAIDDNCNNAIDEENATGCVLRYANSDSDTHGLTADSKCLCANSGIYNTLLSGDCDDTKPTVFPGAAEACNGIDEDCDTQIDETFALGVACDGTGDLDGCQEGITICNAAGTGTTCADDGAGLVVSGDRVDQAGAAVILNEAQGSLNGTWSTGAGSTVAQVAGNIGQAFDFSGGGNVTMPHHVNMNASARGLTVAAWVKMSAAPVGARTSILSKGIDTARSFEWRLHGTTATAPAAPGRLRLYVNVGGAGQFCGDTIDLVSGSWTHVAFSATPNAANTLTTVVVYRNGAVVQTCNYTGSVATNTLPVLLGRAVISGSTDHVPFNGSLDEVVVYPYGLTSTQVSNLHSGGIAALTRNNEICDGLDNNCTAGVDDLYTDKGQSCSQGSGGCANSGTKVCMPSGMATTCSVTGKAAGTACSDSDLCSFGDVCTGGATSTCTGTAYTCTGTCRACDGTGKCTVDSGSCFIAGCDPTQPGCGTAASCVLAAGSKGAAGDDKCLECRPATSQSTWTPAATSVTCNASKCTGLSYASSDFCGTGGNAGKCMDSGTVSCDDGNLCTNDNCADATGCSAAPNSYQEACYTGPVNTLNIGTCTAGIKTCSGGSFGSCVGEVKPVVETCAIANAADGLDNNCDGLVDNASDFTTWYRDLDTDNHGKAADGTTLKCSQPVGYAALNDDCDNNDGANYPGNTEVCDDKDNNCSTTIDETFTLKGLACDDTVDADSCTEGAYVCKADKSGVQCSNDGPIAAFTFDRGISGTAVTDEADGSGNAVLNSTTTVAGVRTTDRALQIVTPSTTSSIRIPSAGFSDVKWSISLWYKPSNVLAQSFVSLAGSTGDNALLLRNDGAMWVKQVQRGTPITMTAGTWYHYVVSFDSATGIINVMQNNVSKLSLNVGTAGFGWSSDLWLGQDQDSPNGGFQLTDAAAGTWDEVSLYNHILTSTETTALFTTKTIASVQRNYEFCDGANNDCVGATDPAYTDLGSACTVGGDPQCSNSGVKVCESVEQISTTCSVTGKPAGTACNDTNACSFTDVCSGGTGSACAGTAYTCSGSCRACNGSGGCTVNGGTCYIAGCNPADRTCTTGACFNQGQDPAGTLNSQNANDNSCKYCDPAVSVSTWTNRPGTWQCLASSCPTALSFDPVHYCGGSGTCNNPTDVSCNDSNVCTTDACSG
ncbi:MAG: hypothetical protein IV100_34740, partial [Myxococcales bacterium]|nr:hypothetical protein [Myxococcales bacterium]